MSNVRSHYTMRLTTLLLLGLALSACEERLTPTTIETSRGTVTYKERVRPDDGKFEEGLRPLSAAEAARLLQGSEQAPAFIAKYVTQAQVRADLLENLDLAFATWLDSSNPAKEPAEQVESVVGAALGQYCIAHVPVHWAVATDPKGSEFVLVGEDPPTRSYPLAAVRYRIEDRKTDFIGALYEALIHLREKAR